MPALSKWLADAGVRRGGRLRDRTHSRRRVEPGSVAAYERVARTTSSLGFWPRSVHRRAAEAVALCLEAARSANPEIAVAGASAFGRIGQEARGPIPRWPEGLSAAARDAVDSLLRYARCGRRQEERRAEAMRSIERRWSVRRSTCSAPAIVGHREDRRRRRPRAAIFPKLKSANRNGADHGGERMERDGEGLTTSLLVMAPFGCHNRTHDHNSKGVPGRRHGRFLVARGRRQ